MPKAVRSVCLERSHVLLYTKTRRGDPAQSVGSPPKSGRYTWYLSGSTGQSAPSRRSMLWKKSRSATPSSSRARSGPRPESTSGRVRSTSDTTPRMQSLTAPSRSGRTWSSSTERRVSRLSDRGSTTTPTSRPRLSARWISRTSAHTSADTLPEAPLQRVYGRSGGALASEGRAAAAQRNALMANSSPCHRNPADPSYKP
mmetsp:Transcript_104340/g.321908  ORF Transcript_104340/g.321908 Transcript_104340/m.321908 type:complete len:200 (+) Transcript_104340:1215-1814(+)